MTAARSGWRRALSAILGIICVILKLHDRLFAQVADGGCVVAELREDLGAMFPQCRRRQRRPHGHSTQLDRIADHADAAYVRMIHPSDIAVFVRLWAIQDIRILGDRRSEQIRRVEVGHPLGRGLRWKDLIKNLLNLIALEISTLPLTIRIFNQIRTTNDGAKTRPSIVLHARQRHPAIGGLERTPYAVQELMPSTGLAIFFADQGGLQNLPRL